MERSLSLRMRLAGLVGAALLGFLASPGVCCADGSVILAVLGVALWAWTAAQPLGPRPRRARLVEGLAGGVAGGLLMWWVVYVWAFGVLAIGAGWSVYAVAMGACLRRLERRLVFPLAVGLAWTGVELVRALLEPPFGLGWFRLGYYAHAQLWLAGSARVIGVEGLTFVLACAGGGVAALVRERRLRLPSLLAALLPLVLAALGALLVPPPATVPGPRVLLVQPGFEQGRKKYGDPLQNFLDSVKLTQNAIADEARRGAPPVDLACWGESMLCAELFGPELEPALQRGERPPSWDPPVDLARMRLDEDQLVRRALLPSLPAGVSLAAGAEYVSPVDGEIRRRVALVIYDHSGKRSPPAFKRHLAPLGETFFGLERFQLVRDLAVAAADYLPDFVAGESTGVLELHCRDGRTFRPSGTVCFDNAYPDPYVSALRAGPVDFHLVASNEAWYRTSCEMDQMIAFSRVFALMTARSFVRATNSGVSLVLGPDGSELGRVRGAGGADRAVAGSGAWTVPVPAPGAAARTPYVVWSSFSPGCWLFLLALALVRPIRRAPQ